MLIYITHILDVNLKIISQSLYLNKTVRAKYHRQVKLYN